MGLGSPCPLSLEFSLCQISRSLETIPGLYLFPKMNAHLTHFKGPRSQTLLYVLSFTETSSLSWEHPSPPTEDAARTINVAAAHSCPLVGTTQKHGGYYREISSLQTPLHHISERLRRTVWNTFLKTWALAVLHEYFVLIILLLVLVLIMLLLVLCFSQRI